MNELLQRVEVLRGGRGWYPESYRVCFYIGTIRAYSSDGKSCVTFNACCAEDTLRLCVEYCEWMNAKKFQKGRSRK